MASEHSQAMNETRASNDPKPGAANLVVDVQFAIPCQRIADMVVTAFEGATTYWLKSALLTRQPTEKLSEAPWYASPELYDGRDFTIRCTPRDDEDYPARDINIEHLRQGFKIMSQKFPKHFADFVSENDDADTADVWFQCVMFGELIFG